MVAVCSLLSPPPHPPPHPSQKRRECERLLRSLRGLLESGAIAIITFRFGTRRFPVERHAAVNEFAVYSRRPVIVKLDGAAAR